MGGFFDVALGRSGAPDLQVLHNPAFLAPALFPLFFFVAFAGGLTRAGDVPGFDYAAGYIAFQYVWASCRPSRWAGLSRIFDRG